MFHSPALFDAPGRQATGRPACGREMPPSMSPFRRSAIHCTPATGLWGFKICSSLPPLQHGHKRVVFYWPTETVTVSVRSCAKTHATPNFKQSPFPPSSFLVNPIVTQLPLRPVVRKPYPSACLPPTCSKSNPRYAVRDRRYAPLMPSASLRSVRADSHSFAQKVVRLLTL